MLQPELNTILSLSSLMSFCTNGRRLHFCKRIILWAIPLQLKMSISLWTFKFSDCKLGTMVQHYVNSGKRTDSWRPSWPTWQCILSKQTTKCQLLVTFCISGTITSNYYLPPNDFFSFSVLVIKPQPSCMSNKYARQASMKDLQK